MSVQKLASAAKISVSQRLLHQGHVRGVKILLANPGSMFRTPPLRGHSDEAGEEQDQTGQGETSQRGFAATPTPNPFASPDRSRRDGFALQPALQVLD